MQQNLWQKQSLSKARQRNPHLETRTKYPGFSLLPSELQNSSPKHSPLCTVCISRHDSLPSSIPPTRSAAHPGSQPNICFPCSRAALQVMYASVCLHAARASGTAQHHVEEQSRAEQSFQATRLILWEKEGLQNPGWPWSSCGSCPENRAGKQLSVTQRT